MTSRLAVLLATTVLLTACGASTGGASGPAPGADPTTGDPSATAAGFPVVIERRGGIAGFRDRVSVAADGTASVETKQGARPACSLGADTAQRLGRAVAALASGSPATARTGVADAMLVTVQTPGGRVHVVPDDAPEPVTVVTEVLTRATAATCG